MRGCGDAVARWCGIRSLFSAPCSGLGKWCIITALALFPRAAEGPCPMTRFSWLHFSDLHQGLDTGHSRWPNVKEALFKDLTELRDRCGNPWDLVLFTGDLTQSGSEKEFLQLNEVLTDL